MLGSVDVLSGRAGYLVAQALGSVSNTAKGEQWLTV